MKQIGDRMKEFYENRYRISLTRRMPVILRVDGVAFHTFTKGCNRPFDQDLINGIVNSVDRLKKKVQGFKVAYCQSDEISILLTDYNTFETAAWFDYNLQKLCSVTASLMTAIFNTEYKHPQGKIAYFDCRAFNIPKEEVCNYFLWRAMDWHRNSINMFSEQFFSHKQLMNKKTVDKHEMLHTIGENWANLDTQVKNGTFVFNDKILTDIKPKYEDIESNLKELIYV